MMQDARICGFGQWMWQVLVGGYLLSAPGVYAGEGVEVRADDSDPASLSDVAISHGPVNANLLNEATPDHPFVNSLGMKFAPVPDPDGRGPLLFSIWPTRVQDFQTFVEDRENHDYDYRYVPGYPRGIPTLVSRNDYYMPDFYYHRTEYGWDNPGFEQSGDHPVACVSWVDIGFFCTWLTTQEQQAGLIPTNWVYRLPTDVEWSLAIGITSEAGDKTKTKIDSDGDAYPWGPEWPPPPDAGNYAGEEVNEVAWDSGFASIPGYKDGYPRTAPVGSFEPNRYGLFDMGGNVWEWCTDPISPSPGGGLPVRGGSWRDSEAKRIRVTSRQYVGRDFRFDYLGFRLVLTPASPDNP